MAMDMRGMSILTLNLATTKILILLAVSLILVQDPEEGKRSRRRFSAGHLDLNQVILGFGIDI